MLAVNIAAAFIQIRYNRLGDIQIVQTNSCRNNIYNRVNCTHFMEMNLILCNTVCLGFGSCNDSENIFRCLFCPIADFRLIDDGKDIPNIAVYVIMVMMVVMMMLVIMVMMVLMFVVVMVLVIMVMMVLVIVVVMMLVIMVVMVLMFVLMRVLVIMLMFVVVMMLMIMVVMVLRLIQNNVKIAGIDTIFLYSTDFQLVTRQI